MVTTDIRAGSPVSCLVIRPNCSSTWRQSLGLLVAVALPLLTVAVVLAWQGFWLVLPFAGLELAVLFGSLYAVGRAAQRCQVVTIGPTTVVVEKGSATWRRSRPPVAVQRLEFARGWVRIERAQDPGRRDTSRLWIGAFGRRVEVGEFLVEAEREILAGELRRLIAAPRPAQE